MKSKTKEPAFPFRGLFPGISKRDYFAALAMQGLLTAIDKSTIDIKMIVKDSYAIADSMVAESEKE